MRVWYGRLALVLALGLGLMAGCGGQGGKKVDASLGTYNYGGPNLGFALLVSGVLDGPTPSFGVPVTVKDSQGNLVFGALIKSSTGGSFNEVSGTASTVESGTYTITATFPGGLQLNKQVQVDATKKLDQPSSVEVSTSQNSATVNWEAVSGAVSYQVVLFEVEGNNQFNPVSEQYTKGTSVTFSNLSAGSYTVYLLASNADLTSRPTQVPDQFNASVVLSEPFAIQ